MVIVNRASLTKNGTGIRENMQKCTSAQTVASPLKSRAGKKLGHSIILTFMP